MNIYEKILDLQKNGNTGVLINVVDKEGHGPQIPGAKLLISSSGEKFGTIGGGALEFAAIKEAENVLTTQKSITKKYLLGENNNIVNAVKTKMICGGTITLFYEYINTKPTVYIFGAGHIGKALVYFLKRLNYNIILVDSRKEMYECIEGVSKFIIGDYSTVLSAEDVSPGSFMIIVTHSHNDDYNVLKRIYTSPWDPKYIGLIASKRKTDIFLKQLSSEFGGKINLNKLYMPIGLNIGGVSPEEIALSIAAEIQAVNCGMPNCNHSRVDA